VSHAGLVLLRELADRTGLTAGLSAALPSPAGGHDRGRVMAELARTRPDEHKGKPGTSGTPQDQKAATRPSAAAISPRER
jgi:hypothetical protein